MVKRSSLVIVTSILCYGSGSTCTRLVSTYTTTIGISYSVSAYYQI